MCVRDTVSPHAFRLHIVHTNISSRARFEALESVLTKSQRFWDMMPSRLVEGYQSFGQAFCLSVVEKDLLDYPEASSELL